MKKSIGFKCILIAAAALVTALITVLDPWYALDSFITDPLYTDLTGPDSGIIIIGVDEETLSEYGNFTTWSRQKTAELIDLLYADPEKAPAVTGVDFLFVDKTGEADKDLIKAVSKANGNIVFGSNIVYRGDVVFDVSGKAYYDTDHIEDLEIPYDELSEVSKTGFVNALIAKDGYVRFSQTNKAIPDEVVKAKELGYDSINSFAYEIYKLYCDNTGRTALIPKENKSGQFRFYYSGKTGEYSHVSFKDVLDGKVPPEAFKDAIVLVGAYAPGMQDAYLPAIDRGKSMYGAETHANLIQAYLENKTAVDINNLVLFLTVFVLSFGYLLFARKNKLPVVLVSSVVVGAIWLILGRILAGGGTYIPCIYIWIFLLIADAVFIVLKYFVEKIKRRHTLDVFKKYVAPEVVESLQKSGDFEIKLGGEKRNIAVLFVDIRGFTPLSESLNPEQVVGILNEYLKLVTDCIFRHGGTIDKFIGDAAMAVFNAPFDLDDYVFKAVASALDICEGGKTLGVRLKEEYGKDVNFGVGVNFGEAVVGNIGSDYRMDYTAIGDTVNTSARLESNAKAGQILISEYVYEEIKDRIEASEVGEIPLKGKSNKIMVYSVTGLKE
ncbi:MAG: adenylate/guanylate cyclase domain-containing protein [Lachnospiraceae bacterium]|nr:adenylate/guanylate cyclase domain-containing protein [Lachnospiraceae bacterium]